MTNFSPAAQAVLDAFHKELPPDNEPGGLAAAIRALAYNVYSDEYVTCGGSSYALMIDMDDILAIADELKISATENQ